MCREMAAKKHKYDVVWKIVAIVSTIIAIIFIVLYFGSGDAVKRTVIENDVQIENSGDGAPMNENIGNIGNDYSPGVSVSIALIILAVVAIAGGVIYGYIAISQGRREKQGANHEQVGRQEENNDKD